MKKQIRLVVVGCVIFLLGMLVNQRLSANDIDQDGFSPLHSCLDRYFYVYDMENMKKSCEEIEKKRKEEIELTKQTIQNGVDMTAKDSLGCTPLALMLVAFEDDRDLEMVRILLENKADPNEKFTAICDEGLKGKEREEELEFINELNKNTYLQYAIEQGHDSLVALLKEFGAK